MQLLEIFLTERVLGNLAVVFHRTKSITNIEAIEQMGFKAGSGDTYGRGVYATYDIASQLNDRMADVYGPYIIKAKVQLYGMLICDAEVAKQVYGRHWRLVDQVRLLKLRKNSDTADYTRADDIKARIAARLRGVVPYESAFMVRVRELSAELENAEFSADIAREIPATIMGMSGMVYTGRQDGRCVVVYDRKKIVPFAYTETNDGSKNDLSWTRLNFASALKALTNAPFVPSDRPVDFTRDSDDDYDDGDIDWNAPIVDRVKKRRDRDLAKRDPESVLTKSGEARRIALERRPDLLFKVMAPNWDDVLSSLEGYKKRKQKVDLATVLTRLSKSPEWVNQSNIIKTMIVSDHQDRFDLAVSILLDSAKNGIVFSYTKMNSLLSRATPEQAKALIEAGALKPEDFDHYSYRAPVETLRLLLRHRRIPDPKLIIDIGYKSPETLADVEPPLTTEERAAFLDRSPKSYAGLFGRPPVADVMALLSNNHVSISSYTADALAKMTLPVRDYPPEYWVKLLRHTFVALPMENNADRLTILKAIIDGDPSRFYYVKGYFYGKEDLFTPAEESIILDMIKRKPPDVVRTLYNEMVSTKFLSPDAVRAFERIILGRAPY